MEWIESLAKSLLASTILLLPMLIIVIPVAWVKKRNKHFKNPLTSNMRRLAGAELSMQLQRARDDLDTPMVYLLMVTPFLLAYYCLLVHWFDISDSITLRAGLVFTWIVSLVYYSLDFLRRGQVIRHLRLGYECELAVAQELDTLMLHGYRVFHDIPAGKFNIDHIVIGSTGVYAIETKGRSKPRRASSEKFDYELTYDGKRLQFPSWTETSPIQQAQRQAKWVSEWLSNATALRVAAKPVLVLPGWWVDRRCKKPGVAVLSGKNMDNFFINGKPIFTYEQVQRIAYQVDQKVRDLEPGVMLKPT